MELTDAIRAIETAFVSMRTAYGEVVFDEWAIIALGTKSWSLEHYSGERRETFIADLSADLKPLAHTSTGKTHAVGDFEFAADARGTRHDAMLRLGPTAYLLCNNTRKAMADIRGHHRWLVTQRYFAEMGDVFRSDPLTLTS